MAIDESEPNDEKVDTPAPAPAEPDTQRAYELRDRADAAFAKGDYRAVVDLDRQIEALSNDEADGRRAGNGEPKVDEMIHDAQSQRRQLGVDRVAVFTGLFATLLYLLGWVVSFW